MPRLWLYLPLITMSATAHGQNLPLRAVAISGDQASGISEPVEYRFNPAAPYAFDVNARGEVNFIAQLIGDSVTGSTNFGIFKVNRTGNGSLVARESDAVPGTTPAAVITSFNTGFVALDAAGDTVFDAALSVGPDSAVLRESSNVLSVFAADGGLVGGLPPGVTFRDPNLTRPMVNSHGEIIANARVEGTGVSSFNDTVIVSGDATPVAIAREGDQVAGLAPGTLYGDLLLGSRSLTDSGLAVLSVDLTGAGVTGFNNTAIVSGAATPSGLTAVARAGDFEPGIDGTHTLGNFTNSAIAETGRVAFASNLSDSTSAFNGSGIYAGMDANSLSAIARKGEQAPGLSQGVHYDALLGSDLVMNQTGQVVFTSRLNGPGISPFDNLGLFAEQPDGSVGLLARSGDLAPGFDDGTVLGDLALSTLQVNEDGVLAAYWSTRSTDGTYRNALFVTDTSGGTFLVAAEGQDIDINPSMGGIRRIDTLYSSYVLGDGGDLVFFARFADGTYGLLAAHVPSPLTSGIFGVLGLSSVLRRPTRVRSDLQHE